MFRLSPGPRVDKNYREEINKARKELQTSILNDKSSARSLLRLAYASQFSIASHFNEDAENTAKKHHEIIEKIHSKHPTITYPDLYQLAGTLAVKALKGPEIDFDPGRKDSPIPPDESCLPDLKQSPKEIAKFFKKVNISDAHYIVALCGGLKLATAGDQSPDLKFDNCFSDLGNKSPSVKTGDQSPSVKTGDQSPSVKTGDQSPSVKTGDQSPSVKTGDRSPSDKTLFEEDSEFSSIVKSYANSNKDFIKNYEEAHKKFSELGLVPYSSAVGVGVAVAAAVVIFSIFYLIHKRRTRHLSHQFP